MQILFAANLRMKRIGPTLAEYLLAYLTIDDQLDAARARWRRSTSARLKPSSLSTRCSSSRMHKYIRLSRHALRRVQYLARLGGQEPPTALPSAPVLVTSDRQSQSCLTASSTRKPEHSPPPDGCVRKVSPLLIDTSRVLIGMFRSTPESVDRKMSIWADCIDQILVHVRSIEAGRSCVDRPGCRVSNSRRSKRQQLSIHDRLWCQLGSKYYDP